MPIRRFSKQKVQFWDDRLPFRYILKAHRNSKKYLDLLCVGGVPRSIHMFCRVTRAFESPRDLTTGQDDIFEENVLIHGTYRNLWQAHMSYWRKVHVKIQERTNKVKTLPFFFALQSHPWCIYWETQSMGKLATNIENKEDAGQRNAQR